jgi:protein O-mannosyl-transferase
MAVRAQTATGLEASLKATLWLPVIVILLVSFGVYFNALFNGWVLDDFPQILQNPWVKSAKYLPEIFSTNAWAFDARESSYYRPLVQVIYMTTHYVFGLRAWGFHLVNLIVHAGVSVLAFLIICRLVPQSKDRRFALLPALLGGLLFATHTIHTEVVAPIMGVHDLSFTFFYLLSFYLYIESGETNKRSHHFCSVAAFLVALFCKEPALTLPVILAVYDVAVKKQKLFSSSALRRYAPYAVAFGIYLIVRFYALGGVVNVHERTTVLSAYVYAINVFPLFAKYLEKLFVPVNLNILHVYHPIRSILEPTAVLSLLVSAISAALVVVAWRRNRVAFLGCVLIVLPLLPALYLPGLNQPIDAAFAERYLYLPSFGLVIVVSSLLGSVNARRPSTSAALAAVAAVVIVLFGVGTLARNPVWKNNYTLWSDAVKKSPDSPAAHRDLGYALLYHKKDVEDARKEFDIAVRLKPELPEAAIGAGVAYGQKGMIDKAIFQFHAALLLKPDSAEAHYNLAIAYDEKGWLNEAIGEYEAVLTLQPENANAHNNLGIAYARKGLNDKALEHFKVAVSLKPEDPEFRSNLERAHKQWGKGNAGAR